MSYLDAYDQESVTQTKLASPEKRAAIGTGCQCWFELEDVETLVSAESGASP